jgi:hypothetical protein
MELSVRPPAAVFRTLETAGPQKGAKSAEIPGFGKDGRRSRPTGGFWQNHFPDIGKRWRLSAHRTKNTTERLAEPTFCFHILFIL